MFLLVFVIIIAFGLLVLFGFGVRALIQNENAGFLLACSFLNFCAGFLVAVCHESIAYQSPTAELMSEMRTYYFLMSALYITACVGPILVIVRAIIKIFTRSKN